MRKFKILSYLFMALAVVLSDVMCATVAYEYCSLQWGGRYAVYSAPTWVAFLFIIPYGVGIVICAALALLFHRKSKK